MTAREMINKYRIAISSNDDSQIVVYNMAMVNIDKARELIISNKPEILSLLKADRDEKQKAERIRKEKIAAIEGLDEIISAQNDEERYHYLFNKAMDDEFNDGVNLPAKPKVNSADLIKRYPRAAAYLKAQSYGYSSNASKSAIGRKALERIINGEDYTSVLEDMESEWSAYVHEHMWN